MKNRYFDFLCNIVGKLEQYLFLLRQLHKIEFYSIVPNDDNRGVDGEHLRDEFCDMEGGPQALSLCPDEPCTILEMLIGLSYRLEFETAQSKYEKTPREWFWILIDNLDLSWANNEVFYNEDTVKSIQYIIESLLERRYSYSGEGGLFPLKNPKKDQRKVEIWYQMSAYILENYPI